MNKMIFEISFVDIIFYRIFYFTSFLDAINDDFEKSHEFFREAFTEGFPWELIKVIQPNPPKIMFSWRHWAKFTGQFQGRPGKGELIELYGLCEATVNEDLKIEALEVNLHKNIQRYLEPK